MGVVGCAVGLRNSVGSCRLFILGCFGLLFSVFLFVVFDCFDFLFAYGWLFVFVVCGGVLCLLVFVVLDPFRIACVCVLDLTFILFACSWWIGCCLLRYDLL